MNATLTRAEALDLVDTYEAEGRLAVLAAHWELAGHWNAHATWDADTLREHVDASCVDGDAIRSYGPSDDDETCLTDPYAPHDAMIAALAGLGFTREHTGGNCEAMQYARPDGAYALVTDWEDPTLPTSCGPWAFGTYTADGYEATECERFTDMAALIARAARYVNKGA